MHYQLPIITKNLIVDVATNDICQNFGQNMKLTQYINGQTQQSEIPFDSKIVFDKGILLGKGAFGEVRQITFDYGLNNEAALKKQIFNFSKQHLIPLVKTELKLTAKMAELNVGPQFYGCQ